MINGFLKKSIESFAFKISKLILWNGSMSNNYIIFLLDVFDINIIELSDVAGSHNPIHLWHIYIHQNKSIRLSILVNPLFAFHNCFFSTHSLIHCNIILLLENHLQNLYVKNCVVYN